MGSGCTGTFNGYFGKIIPDTGIQYTGAAFSTLGVCTNDKLNEVEKVILQTLTNYATGVGISFPDIDLTHQCSFFDQFITCCAQDKSLEGFIKVLLAGECALSTTVSTLTAEIAAINGVTFNVGCLTVATPTLQNVVNATIAQVCLNKTNITTLQGQVTAINSAITNNTTISAGASSYLASNLASCNGGITVTKDGSNNNIFTLTAFPPVGAAIPYFGAISNFDGTGKGLSNKGTCGWAICNGNNGTPDMRGFTFGGATQSVPGGTLNPIVDPSSDPDLATSIGTIKGQAKHSLLSAENGPHTHGVSDPQHSHSIPNLKYPGVHKAAGDGSSSGFPDIGYDTSSQIPTNASSTGISVQTSGTGAPHENRQPTIYGLWIMRIS